MRRKGASEKYVRVIQDMYEGSRTRVRSSVGATEEFCVRVGLHQGSSLSPYLFNLLMDDSIQNIKEEAPWTMLFADDIVLVDESRDGVERKLERWRRALEERADGNLDGEIIHRIQSGWKNWKRTTGVLCDRKISARVKGKVFKSVVRPAMLYGAETWPIKKAQENKVARGPRDLCLRLARVAMWLAVHRVVHTTIQELKGGSGPILGAER
ncbi:uncharacterized protein LOC123504878 [Portunus trituberculatus]|uniref:uncharacterized protein LOC123504878 n=1 Tax=Portunus trituberculatus TaxID=210409 RepID=UPI001E1CE30E|nr:uncharacterized protein LOC123504878 [Portunus trituberculatus]